MIRNFEPADLDAVQRLLLDNGWSSRVRNAQRLAEIIKSATRAVVAEVDSSLVGFGRCLTDGKSNGYLSMVVVAESHRRQGWGRRIVESLMGEDDRLTWVLRAGHTGSERFWEALGFRQSDTAYERPRI